MKVVVCGSRGWKDVYAIRERLERLPEGTEILVGGARGADTIAEYIARSMGFRVTVFRPKWRTAEGRYNRHAGFERNVEMLRSGPDLVIAFWDGRSAGTRHTLLCAWKLNISIEVSPVGVDRSAPWRGYSSGSQGNLFVA